jgi:hypothetical protein
MNPRISLADAPVLVRRWLLDFLPTDEHTVGI